MVKERAIPFFLREAALALYVADANGAPTGSSIWWALCNSLTQLDTHHGVQLAASGAAAETNHVTHTDTELQLEKTWLLRPYALTQFKPQPATQYVLAATWTVKGYWYRRLFTGLTPRTQGWNSQGTNSFLQNETWRAEGWTDAGGASITTPLPPPSAESSILPFTWLRDASLIVGEALLGEYRWRSEAVLLTTVRVTVATPGTGDSVLALEVGGVVTGTTVTIASGAASAAATLNALIPANQLVRWVIQSCPAPDLAPGGIGLTADVQCRTAAVGWFREPLAKADDYLLGHFRWEEAVTIASVRVGAMAGQGVDTVLELELSGVLTGVTVTLPAAAGGPQSVEATLNVAVAAGVPVRWKIRSCPAADAAPYGIMLLAELV